MAIEPDDVPPTGPGGKDPDMRRYRHTWRLRFEYDGRDLHLRSRTRVTMIAPPSVGRRPKLGTDPGYWVELVDDENRLLFHRMVPGALSTRVEHHRPDGTPEVYVGEPQPGEFEILVPDIPGGKQIVVNGRPFDGERAAELDGGSEELARFSLDPDADPEGATGAETDTGADDDDRNGDD